MDLVKSLGLGLILSFSVIPLFAAPPFITDDPAPVDYQHWQFYLFSMLDKSEVFHQENVPSFTVNYGLFPNLEASLTFGFLSFSQTLFTEPPTRIRAYGFTDMVLIPKYMLIKESEHFPQVAFAPNISLPTGDRSRGLGNGYSIITYPLWLQKTWGQWTTYGGGGYVDNLAPNTKDFFFEGWVLQNQLSDEWMLGMELFNQNGNIITGQPITFATLGGSYTFKSKVSVLFSISNQIRGERHLLAYLGLYYEI